MVELDFADLSPATAPDRDVVKRAMADAERVSVTGPVGALGTVLSVLHRSNRLEMGVSWTPTGDPLAEGLSRTLGLDVGGRMKGESVRTLSLIRDDQGGVLLARGRIQSLPKVAGTRGPSRSRFGAQIYHDDQLLADGEIQRLDVRPDWTAVDSLRVTVHKQLWRRGESTSGRAVQVACDPAEIEVDGVPFPRPMTTWTWYADPRLRWTLLST